MRGLPALGAALVLGAVQYAAAEIPAPAEGSMRVATFNVAMNRKGPGELARELAAGPGEEVAAVIAIIGLVRPDVLVLNEFDHDREDRALRDFAGLIRSAGGPDYGWLHSGPVNSGEPSGLDIDGDGRTGEPEDAWGFGRFPGQYGMAVLSRLPLRFEAARSFRLTRWADLPWARLPRRADGTPFPSAEVQAALRLSSKSHWDLALVWPGGTGVSLLVSHPTPPVFDGPEDLNGLRNRDEILFWVRYLEGEAVTDDAGRTAPRSPGPFIVAGDLNADPVDGDGRRDGIGALLAVPGLTDPRPSSPGGRIAGTGGANEGQAGDPGLDTADFRDEGGPGNLRVDYVLPSAEFEVTGAGVFWPAPDDPMARLTGGERPVSSDHRLVWVDLRLR